MVQRRNDGAVEKRELPFGVALRYIISPWVDDLRAEFVQFLRRSFRDLIRCDSFRTTHRGKSLELAGRFHQNAI